MASSAATGEFILWLDADDRLGPASLAARLAYLAGSDTRTLTVCRNRVFSAAVDDDRAGAGASWWLPPTALATRLLHSETDRGTNSPASLSSSMQQQ